MSELFVDVGNRPTLEVESQENNLLIIIQACFDSQISLNGA